MKLPYLRATTYGYDTNAAGDESGLKCEDKSLAQQHMADECDINKLVERFVVTGELPYLEVPPLQGDFTEAPTMQDALNLMTEARHTFMGLNARIRAQFDNDPAQFVDFASNPENTHQMREWGMWDPKALEAFENRAKAQKQAEEANRLDAEKYREEQKKVTKGVT